MIDLQGDNLPTVRDCIHGFGFIVENIKCKFVERRSKTRFKQVILKGVVIN